MIEYTQTTGTCSVVQLFECATTMFFVSLNNVVVIFCWYYHHYFMDSWLFDLVTLQSFKFKLFFVSFPFPVFLMCVFEVHFQFVH